MTDHLESLWSSFEQALERLDASCQPEAAGYRREVSRSANEVFALRGGVGYIPHPAHSSDELLVVSLDMKWDGPAVVGEIDLAWGDGGVLAHSVVPRVEGDGTGLDDAVVVVERFIDAITPLVRRGLLAGERT